MKLTKIVGLSTNKWYYLFIVLSFLLSTFPLFLFEYFITFDGPWHYYNAVIQSHLSQGDVFNQTFYVFNDQTVSNYIGQYLLYFYYSLFGVGGALKAFHITYTLLFLGGLLYWINRPNFKSLFIPLLFPLIISFVFISGFYNFALAITFSFFLLGYYERIENKLLKHYFILTLALGLIYFTHILVFVFIGIALINKELENYTLNKDPFKTLVQHLFKLLLTAIPYIILSLFFLESRDNTLSFSSSDALIEQFTSGRSIYSRGDFATVVLQLLMLTTIIVALIRLWKKHTSNNYLLGAAITSLVLYIVAPNQIGHVGVLSIRYLFFFWLFLLVWLAKNPFENRILNWTLLSFSLFLAGSKVTGIYTMQKQLNLDTKLVIEAAKTIPEESIVYPIFSSNFWEHYYLGCYFGIDRNNLVLKNNAAHNDYFPLKYRTDYEAQIKASGLLEIHLDTIKRPVDYLVIIGKEPIEHEQDLLFYSRATSLGKKVSENDLVTIWALK